MPEPGEIERARPEERRRDGPAAVAFDPFVLGGEIQRRLGVKTSRDEPLARFTTIRVGGPADLFAAAHNVFELRRSSASPGRARSR